MLARLLRLILIVLILCTSSATATQASPEKLSLSSFSVSPQSISPSPTQEDPATVNLRFHLRTSDALRAWIQGQEPNSISRSFLLRSIVEVRDEAAAVVQTLQAELLCPRPKSLPF